MDETDLFSLVQSPQYYLQAPPTVPNFYATLFRRNIVKWFLVAEVLRDFWLSTPYGRNWQFLWSGKNDIPIWGLIILIVVFFIVVWSGVLWGLTRAFFRLYPIPCLCS